MVSEPTLSLLLVLSVLEGVVYNDGEVVTTSLLAFEGVDVVLLDEEDALLISCEGTVSSVKLKVRGAVLASCRLSLPLSLLKNGTE